MLRWIKKTSLTIKTQKLNGLSNGRVWAMSVALGNLLVQVCLPHPEELSSLMHSRGGQMLQSNEPDGKAKKRLVLVEYILF